MFAKWIKCMRIYFNMLTIRKRKLMGKKNCKKVQNKKGFFVVVQSSNIRKKKNLITFCVIIVAFSPEFTSLYETEFQGFKIINSIHLKTEFHLLVVLINASSKEFYSLCDFQLLKILF